MTIEPEFSLDQPRQINYLVPDRVLAKDRRGLRAASVVASLGVGLRVWRRSRRRAPRAATRQGCLRIRAV